MIRKPTAGRRGPRKFGRRPFIKKKVCRFCADKIDIDYKVPSMLKSFTSDRGKILAGRFTGTCAKHQRQLVRAIKRARHLALIPYIAELTK